MSEIDEYKGAGWLHPDHIHHVAYTLGDIYGNEGEWENVGMVWYYDEAAEHEMPSGLHMNVTVDEGSKVVVNYPVHQHFNDGPKGLFDAVLRLIHDMENIPTIAYRWMMISQGISVEQRGMRLTSKAPACSAIVKREHGVKRNLSKKKTGVVWQALMMIVSDYQEHMAEVKA